jgi:hypothetical protein
MQLIKDSRELVPEAASSTSEASSLARGADVLAGESSADEIDGFEISSTNAADIIEPLRLGPVLRENREAQLVLLDLPDRLANARHLQAQLEPADAAEERADLHAAMSCMRSV